jgi:Zn-dependent peptidase ImmA (M78 family)
MGYRRGFKSEASSIAVEVRAELRLSVLDRLDPMHLADHLAVPVVALSELAGCSTDAIRILTEVEPDAFSAVTVFDRSRRTIVHNDAHAPGRQVSNITHELAHGLLHHRPSAALDDRGCRLWSQDIEDEAQWLAGALLIPDDAAIWIVRQGMTESDAAQRFGVTPPMVRFRVNVSGARARVARGQRLRACMTH